MSDADRRVQVLYVGIVVTGPITGPEAALTAVNTLFDGQHPEPLAQNTTLVDMCLTTDGIMLTDNLRRCSEL